MAIQQRNFYPVLLKKVLYDTPNFKTLAFTSTQNIYNDPNVVTNTFNKDTNIIAILPFDFPISEDNINQPYFIKTKKEFNKKYGEQNTIEAITKAYQSITKKTQKEMIDLLLTKTSFKTKQYIQDALSKCNKTESESLDILKQKHEELVKSNKEDDDTTNMQLFFDDPFEPTHYKHLCPICQIKKELTLNEKIEILLKREKIENSLIQWVKKQNTNEPIDCYDTSEKSKLKECYKLEKTIEKNYNELKIETVKERTEGYIRKVFEASILKVEQTNKNNHIDFVCAADIVDVYHEFDSKLKPNYNKKETNQTINKKLVAQESINFNDQFLHNKTKAKLRDDDFITIVDRTLPKREIAKLVTINDYKQFKRRNNLINTLLSPTSNNQRNYNNKKYEAWLNNQIVIPTIEQTEAITEILNGNSISLTGAAGTGKTQTTELIIKAVELFRKSTEIINLASTGEAANNMKVNYNIKDAKTLHSYAYSTSTASKNEVLIVIDEASMLDNDIIDKLIHKIQIIKSENRLLQLLFIGDIEQLPPVGKGIPFHEFIKYGKKVKLTQQFRQQNGSKILKNLDKILDQTFELNVTSQWQTQDDIHYKKVNSADTENTVLDFIKEKNITIEDLKNNNWKIITPINRVRHRLNDVLQETLNPQANDLNKITIKRNKNSITFNLNSIMVINTNGYYVAYDNKFKDFRKKGDAKLKEICGNDTPETTNLLGLNKVKGFNGQTGYISEIILEANTGNPLGFLVQTQEIKKPLFFYINAFDMTKQIDLAFAKSVHKSQGGQCDHVLFVDTESSSWSRKKNLVYTANSRTKNDVYLMTNMSHYTIENSTLNSFMMSINQPAIHLI